MEIERKWLLDGEPDPRTLKIVKSGYLVQAYFYDQDGSSIRVRSASWGKKNPRYDTDTDCEFWLTVKTPVDELARNELEIPISSHVFETLIHDEATGSQIDKCRWVSPLDGGLLAEIDIFYGSLDGLVTVEVEFESREDAQLFEAPDWFGKEVTGDFRYLNSHLARTQRVPS